jgi:DNA-binding MarR family transcriptional regulator
MSSARSPCHCNGLRRATRAITGLYDRTLEPIGLTLPQLSLLRQLKRAGPLSVTRLAVVVGLERTTLGRNLRPLEQRGLIESVASEIDARERVVQVTSRGDRAMKSAAPLWRNAQQTVEQGLGRERLELLHEILDKLVALGA